VRREDGDVQIPGKKIVEKAEAKGNEVEIPKTERLGLVDFFKLTFKEVGEDHVAAFAGNLTYKTLFAIFPFFTFLLSLLGLFNARSLVNDMIASLQGVLSGQTVELIERQLIPLTQSQAESAFTFGAIISILLALWGVSGAFRSIMEAMNVMYEVEEDRPAWKLYGTSIFMSLAVVVLMISAFALVVFGEPIAQSVAEAVGLGSVFTLVWGIVQWPILALIVLLTFALIYFFAPAAKQKFRWISPGAILAFGFWLGFTLLFSLYTSTLGSDSFSATYGSLAGVIIFMLYVYYSSFIMLLGAEMNQVIEWHIPGGKNEGEKIPEEDRKPDVRPLARAKEGEEGT
jgi:membrane protein